MKKILFLFIMLVVSVFGEDRAIKVEDFSTENRVALVIGNSDYEFNPLKNPVNDAIEMAKELENLGFDVSLKTNLDRKSMALAIKDFGKKIRNGGVALFYFAGHGVQVEGVNYLIPVKSDIINELDVEFEAIEARRILSEMEDAGNKMNIIILDSCRNNPFESANRGENFGLARMDAPNGSLLVYSTSPGKTALDGEDEKNGIFTSSFLTELRTNPSLNLSEILINVRNRVMEKTNGLQVPWESSSLTGKFYFKTPLLQNETEKINGSMLKNKYKDLVEYRKLLEKDYISITDLENSSYLSIEEKIALWEDFLERFPNDNNYLGNAKEKIAYWKNELKQGGKSTKTVKKTSKTEKWILREDFNDNANDWSTGFYNDYSLDVNYGTYYIYDKESFRKTWKNNVLPSNEDFELTTEIKRISGITNNGLNVIFGMDNDGKKYYTFGTTGNGYYSVFKYDNGWQTPIPWTKSDIINSDTNKLTIIKENGILFFYVNDVFLTQLEDFDWYGPAVGFGINSSIEAEVDYLYINRRDDNSYITFEDDFDDNKNSWIEMNNTDQYLKVNNGNYGIYNKNAFQRIWRRNVIDNQDMFSIEAYIQKVSGTDEKAMNVIFAADNETEKFLSFGISGNGQYIMSLYNDGWSNYIPWSQSKYINRFNGINRIKILKVYDTYYFFINGHYVDQIAYIYDWFGPAVGLGINEGIEVKLDYISAKEYNTEPAIYARSKVVVLEDTFETNKYQWPEYFESGQREFEVKNGHYTLYNANNFDKVFQYNVLTYFEDNYEIEAVVKKGKGKDNNILGLIFNMSLDGKKYYAFGINNQGSYALFEYDGSWKTHISWTYSDTIKNNDFNKIKVVKTGTQLDLYINDTYINSFYNFESYGIDVGLGMASGIEMIVDSLKVTRTSL